MLACLKMRTYLILLRQAGGLPLQLGAVQISTSQGLKQG
jgi:hypothetical protein